MVTRDWEKDRGKFLFNEHREDESSPETDDRGRTV